MICVSRLIRSTALVGVGLMLANGASAQISTINSVKLFPYELNGDSGSVLTFTNNYPTSIMIKDESVDTKNMATSYANRHVWRFSADNGNTAFTLTNDSFFEVFLTIKLTGTPISPRKEAGFLFHSTAGGDAQYIVDTDAHEIAAFNGPLPFYKFTAQYNSGDTIRLGMTYYKDPADGKRKIIYHANADSSPPQAFTNNEQGIISGSTLGGYMQVFIDPGNASNAGEADFSDFSIKALHTVSGTLTLKGIVSTAAAQTITFTFRPASGPDVVRTASVGPDGAFTLPTVPADSYTLHIKGEKYLAANVAVDATNGDVSGVTATLRPGDVNNDNRVGILDLGLLADTYLKSQGQTGYNANADLNGDNKVDILDLGLLADFYLEVGDP
jgi:hypothetical protein